MNCKQTPSRINVDGCMHNFYTDILVSNLCKYLREKPDIWLIRRVNKTAFFEIDNRFFIDEYSLFQLSCL